MSEHRLYRPSVGLLSSVLAVILASCASVAAPLPQPLTASATSQASASPASENTVTRPPTLSPTLNASPTLVTTSTPTPTSTITPTPTITLTPTPDTRPLPDYWRSWPVIPTVSGRLKEIYLKGQALGNDPKSFTRIGDCQSIPEVFLGIYDTDRYWLGENYQYLQTTIDRFSGAFGRENITAKDGFGVNSVFTPLMADPALCSSDETPLDCEYRLHKPIVAFVSMGTNWAPGSSARFEEYLRKIVDFCLEHGIIPVLMTKADNIEQDYLLNESIAQVAYDYDVPLLNTWAAVQYLPNKGLEADGIYLTPAAWDERAFTALITLDAVWTQLQAWDAP